MIFVYHLGGLIKFTQNPFLKPSYGSGTSRS